MESYAVKDCLALGTGLCKPFWAIDLKQVKREQQSDILITWRPAWYVGENSPIRKHMTGKGLSVGAYIGFLLLANSC